MALYELTVETDGFSDFQDDLAEWFRASASLFDSIADPNIKAVQAIKVEYGADGVGYLETPLYN